MVTGYKVERQGPRTLAECWLEWRGPKPMLPRDYSAAWQFAGRWRHDATEAVRFRLIVGTDRINVLSSVEERGGVKHYRVSFYRGVREVADRAMMRRVRSDFSMQKADEHPNEKPIEHIRSLWLPLPLN